MAILPNDFRNLSEKYNIDPFGQLLFVAFLVFVFLCNCNADIGNLIAVLHLAHFWILAQRANNNDFVYTQHDYTPAATGTDGQLFN